MDAGSKVKTKIRTGVFQGAVLVKGVQAPMIEGIRPKINIITEKPYNNRASC